MCRSKTSTLSLVSSVTGTGSAEGQMSSVSVSYSLFKIERVFENETGISSVFKKVSKVVT